MGMYTELHFNCQLKKDVPNNVLQVLRFMLADWPTDTPPPPLPNHPLFKDDGRWRFMLRCDSYYFDADTHSTVRYDEIAQAHYLCIRCNLKNYEGDIEHFINWILPYCDTYPGKFLGFYRYETNETPTLIHAPEPINKLPYSILRWRRNNVG